MVTAMSTPEIRANRQPARAAAQDHAGQARRATARAPSRCLHPPRVPDRRSVADCPGPPYICSMAAPSPLETTLLPGARELLAFHARELPQRDDLCGAFCGALALRAAGVEPPTGEPIDQDAVALAAGSVVAATPDLSHLPHGETGRRDYRLALPFVDDAAVSGTTAAGVVGAIERLAGGALAAIPYSGPWTAGTLDGLFELVAGLERPVALIANLATHHLWGGHARLDQLLAYLYEGAQQRPAARLGRGALRLRVRPRAGPARHPLRRRRHLPRAGPRRRARAAGRAARGGDRAAPPKPGDTRLRRASPFRPARRGRGGRARRRRCRERACGRA